MTCEPIKVLFAVLSTYERNGWHHPSITQFLCEMPFRAGFASRFVPVHNFVPAASGRNMLAKQVKDADMDWICMLDNDMNVPENLLDTIKDAPKDASIIVPEFYMWSQGDLKLTLCWGLDNATADGTVQKLSPGYHELTKCGTGAIFIKPEVFRALDYPYFTYLYNEDAGMYGTEDIQFIQRAREKGFKVYGNTQVKVGHFHSVDIGTMWQWYDQRISLDKEKQMAVESVT